MNEIRVGVFGAWRGRAYMKALKCLDGAKVTAICDKFEDRIEEAKKLCEGEVATYSDFDEFINSGKFDALFLCNYFNEHAQYAIKALEHGIHVFSETMAASTMALCVKLCRAVEKSSAVYMFAENYPFTRSALEMKRLYEGGTLGDIRFAEGEYVHPMDPAESFKYNNPATNGEFHWRQFLPCTYYSSHALAPLMYMTGTMPKAVVAMAAEDTPEQIELYHKKRTDAAGVMLVKMDNGAVYRVNGSTYLAPHGNWYRLAGTKGAAETVRGEEKKVRLTYNKWSAPEGVEETSSIYVAQWANQDEAEAADKNGHGGSDYWVVKAFLEAIRSGKPNFLDVYRATALSATAILGWRSVLDGSKCYKIPNFRLARDCRKWENDDLTPFPAEGKPNDIPYNSSEGKKLF